MLFAEQGLAISFVVWIADRLTGRLRIMIQFLAILNKTKLQAYISSAIGLQTR
jgi:hypothetical protein